MALSSIKEEFKNKRVAFNNSATPLDKRDDIDELAIIALQSNDQSLLRLFDHLPSLIDLKKNRIGPELREIVLAVREKRKN